jgi:ferredoxin
MAEIVFESDNIVRQVPDGAKIADAADEADASLPFGCREGSCGTCRVLVLEGMSNLDDLNDNEKDCLDADEIVGGYRLACQLGIKSGRVVLRNG